MFVAGGTRVGWLGRAIAWSAVVAAVVLVPAANTLLGGAGGARAETPAAFHDGHLHLAVPSGGQWYNVDIAFLVEGPEDPAKDAATAASIAARFPGAVRADEGGASAQYVRNGYWWPSHTASWSYNSAGKPAGLSGELDALLAATATWGAAGANFSYSGGDPTTANTGACSGGGPDKRNTVGWAPQPGATLAVTCSWYLQTGNPATETEFDMQIDPAWNWTTGASPQIDLQSVALHEFGHALGLGHSTDSSAVMYASYMSGTLKRTLQPDDLTGIRAVYGASTQPPASGTPGSAPLSPPSLALRPGANLLTWPGTTAAPGSALGSGTNALQAVYGYDPATGTWQRYVPGVPAFVNTLSSLQQGQAYWFVATANAQIAAP